MWRYSNISRTWGILVEEDGLFVAGARPLALGWGCQWDGIFEPETPQERSQGLMYVLWAVDQTLFGTDELDRSARPHPRPVGSGRIPRWGIRRADGEHFKYYTVDHMVSNGGAWSIRDA